MQVEDHDSYTWHLVHLDAAVTGELPTVVRSDLAAEHAECGWKAERLPSVLEVDGVGCRRPSTPNPVLTGAPGQGLHC